MNIDIILAIALTSLIWLIISIIVFYQSKRRTEKILTDSIQNIKGLKSEYDKKLEELLKGKHEELIKNYEKGYSDSENKKDLSIQIFPWKEETDTSTLWKNRKSVKIGYKHQLFSNGIPCFEPHISVVEEITIDKLNEENIKRVFDNLDLVINNIPNTGNIGVKVIGSAKDLANTLISQIKKKK